MSGKAGCWQKPLLGNQKSYINFPSCYLESLRQDFIYLTFSFPIKKIGTTMFFLLKIFL